MGFRPNDKCTVCRVIREENEDHLKSPLYKACNLYHTRGITLTALANNYPELKYAALRNHTLKHQNPSTQQLKKNFKVEQRKSQLEYARANEMTQRHHTSDRDEMVQKAMEALRQGDMKLSASVLAKLLKDEADIEAKAKDQNIDILRIMTQSRSGETKGLVNPQLKPFDPWKQDAIETEASES